MERKSNKLIEEFMKVKEAFIMEELKPYFENGNLKQKVKIRLKEIKEVRQEFAKRIERLKEGCTFCGKKNIPVFRKKKCKHSLCNRCFNNLHDNDSLQIKELLNNKIDKIMGEENE